MSNSLQKPKILKFHFFSWMKLLDIQFFQVSPMSKSVLKGRYPSFFHYFSGFLWFIKGLYSLKCVQTSQRSQNYAAGDLLNRHREDCAW